MNMDDAFKEGFDPEAIRMAASYQQKSNKINAKISSLSLEDSIDDYIKIYDGIRSDAESDSLLGQFIEKSFSLIQEKYSGKARYELSKLGSGLSDKTLSYTSYGNSIYDIQNFIASVNPAANTIRVSNEGKEEEVPTFGYLKAIESSELADDFLTHHYRRLLFNIEEPVSLAQREQYKIHNLYSLREFLKINSCVGLADIMDYVKSLDDPVLQMRILKNYELYKDKVDGGQIDFNSYIGSQIGGRILELEHEFEKRPIANHLSNLVNRSRMLAKKEEVLSRVYKKYPQIQNADVDDAIKFLAHRNHKLHKELVGYDSAFKLFNYSMFYDLDGSYSKECEELQKDVVWSKVLNKKSGFKKFIKNIGEHIRDNRELSDIVANTSVLVGSYGLTYMVTQNPAISGTVSLAAYGLKGKVKNGVSTIAKEFLPVLKEDSLEQGGRLKELYFSPRGGYFWADKVGAPLLTGVGLQLLTQRYGETAVNGFINGIFDLLNGGKFFNLEVPGVLSLAEKIPLVGPIFGLMDKGLDAVQTAYQGLSMGAGGYVAAGVLLYYASPLLSKIPIVNIILLPVTATHGFLKQKFRDYKHEVKGVYKEKDRQKVERRIKERTKIEGE